MRWPRLSLRSTVALTIAGSVLLPTAVFWQFDQRMTRASYEPLIEQSRQAMLVMAASALVEPIWTLDERVTRATANQALHDPTVLRLRLVETRPNALPLELTRPEAKAQAGVPLHTPILREGLVLGDLTMWFDDQQLDALLAERSRTALRLAELQIVVSLALLLPLMLRRLLWPIQRLKDQASAIANRTPASTMSWDRRDELGELGQHLNAVNLQITALFERAQAQQAELQKIALHDALTGLPNRRLFAELTQAAVAAAQRDGGRLALLFVDVDHFKSINDSCGHAAGDLVLQTLAHRLRGAVRQADVVCRHSGDEFTVLLRNVDSLEEVATMADRLLKEAELPVRHGDRDLAVSASIGIALFPDDARDHDELVGHADTAMYAAKQLGRARCSFYRAELNTRLEAQAEMAQALLRALRDGEFRLFYQPLVRADDGRLMGCEALLRWQHPQRGLVSPADFIPAAEHSGLVSELGAFTIQGACAQIARWKAAGLAFGTVAVNVSALEFRHHRLIDVVTQALAEHGVKPHELELEVTESVLMTDTDSTRRIVDRLQALGLRVVVDDFGTGYSSLAYLKHLRPSKVKIDRAFVRDLPDDADDRVLVPAIVQLAHSLGIAVVAEGVETEAQRTFLQQCGCDLLQGYAISRPQPGEGFELLLHRAGAATAPAAADDDAAPITPSC
jgi:diguanylate cyclase (GGDEF)-like protein